MVQHSKENKQPFSSLSGPSNLKRDIILKQILGNCIYNYPIPELNNLEDRRI